MTANTLPGFDVGQNDNGVTPHKKDKRWRGQFRFWLDANKPDQFSIGQYLMALKSERKFAPTIRDAIRLIRDLRAGNTAVLCELFPWIPAAFAPPQPTAGDEFAEIIADQQAALLAKIDALAAPAIPAEPPPQARSPHNPPIIPPESVASPGIAPSVTPTAVLSVAPPVPRVSGPLPMKGANTAIPGPVFDDDGSDALVIKRRTDTDANRNFLASVNALVTA